MSCSCTLFSGAYLGSSWQCAASEADLQCVLESVQCLVNDAVVQKPRSLRITFVFNVFHNLSGIESAAFSPLVPAFVLTQFVQHTEVGIFFLLI